MWRLCPPSSLYTSSTTTVDKYFSHHQQSRLSLTVRTVKVINAIVVTMTVIMMLIDDGKVIIYFSFGIFAFLRISVYDGVKKIGLVKKS